MAEITYRAEAIAACRNRGLGDVSRGPGFLACRLSALVVVLSAAAAIAFAEIRVPKTALPLLGEVQEVSESGNLVVALLSTSTSFKQEGEPKFFFVRAEQISPAISMRLSRTNGLERDAKTGRLLLSLDTRIAYEPAERRMSTVRAGSRVALLVVIGEQSLAQLTWCVLFSRLASDEA